MNKSEKKTAQKIIVISFIIILFEYYIISIVGGVFFRTILAFFALKYLEEKNYFAIKIILLIFFVPIIWGVYMVLRSYLTL
jgi:hypothetical protein